MRVSWKWKWWGRDWKRESVERGAERILDLRNLSRSKTGHCFCRNWTTVLRCEPKRSEHGCKHRSEKWFEHWSDKRDPFEKSSLFELLSCDSSTLGYQNCHKRLDLSFINVFTYYLSDQDQPEYIWPDSNLRGKGWVAQGLRDLLLVQLTQRASSSWQEWPRRGRN